MRNGVQEILQYGKLRWEYLLNPEQQLVVTFTAPYLQKRQRFPET